MLLPLGKNGLTSLFKEDRVFKKFELLSRICAREFLSSRRQLPRCGISVSLQSLNCCPTSRGTPEPPRDEIQIFVSIFWVLWSWVARGLFEGTCAHGYVGDAQIIFWKDKICKISRGYITVIIPTQRREKNCNCDRNIRGFKEAQHQSLHYINDSPRNLML